MDDTTTLLLAGFAGLLCVAAAGLIAFAAYLVLQRDNQGAPPPRPQQAPVNLSGPGPASLGAPPAPGHEDDYVPEDEMPTVVVNPSVSRPSSLDSGSMPPAPTRRSSGATIIAFDDDDDDD